MVLLKTLQISSASYITTLLPTQKFSSHYLPLHFSFDQINYITHITNTFYVVQVLDTKGQLAKTEIKSSSRLK